MNKFKFAVKLTAVLFVCAVMTVCAMAVSAAGFSDMDGHWSQSYVDYGVSKGYINGYPDGTFLPDKSVTRAEFSKMLNAALGISRKADISFFDVEEDAWYYPEVQKAVYAGYATGYENGSFLADNLITRQEAAVILSRIATRADSTVSLDSFTDAEDISAWAADAMRFAFAKGFMTGDDLGQLLPTAALTRAQASKII
ncbi:MAG: S-layer homology domain-containing protein, partial [Eubacteriales bacterium]